jgi:hypothetical protein
VCLAVYLAATVPLPTQLAANGGGVEISDLVDEDEPVRARMSATHVYYVATEDGCGCGFQLGQYPIDEDNEDEVTEGHRKATSLVALADFVEAHLPDAGGVELYACWQGEQALAAEHHRDVSADDLRAATFFFRQREHVTVRAAAAAG